MTDVRGWIESPRYDLSLLTLPLLLGPVICLVVSAAPQHRDALILGTFFVLGMPHYLSSYGFYLDDANRAYYRTRSAAFYFGPVAVVLLLTLCLVVHLYNLVAAVVAVWNVYHVSRQSHGILSVYRQLGGGDHLRERGTANLALLGVNAGMFALVMNRQPNVAYFLSFLPPWTPSMLAVSALATGIASLGILLSRVRRRPMRPSLPEWAFLAASILLFTPFLLVEDVTLATAALLTGHYIQYLGIIWLLNHRKYTHVTGSGSQRALAWLSQNRSALVVMLVLIGASAAAFYGIAADAQAVTAWVFNAVVLLHFYVDGLCWALRHPYIRQSIGPFLVLPEHRRLAAAKPGSVTGPSPFAPPPESAVG